MSYKVEINVGGVWLPATHKYFQDKEKAQTFENRFISVNFPVQAQETRVRKVGKEKKGGRSDFFQGWDEFL